MRKLIWMFVVAVALAAGAAVYDGRILQYVSQGAGAAPQPGSAPGGQAPPAGRRPSSGGPGGMGAMARPPMTVELAKPARATVSDHIMVVGNLIGAATVEVVPRVTGRLQTIEVRLGDPVRRGQLIARIENHEIREQVRQAEASFQVAQATIRQREADLKFTETNLERSRNLFARQLLPQQSLDDAEARSQAANAQLELARAQATQARARLDELQFTLANTRILSPVDGYVGRRYLDPGAMATQSNPVASVVDIHIVRLIANLVEKDLRRIQAGVPATVDVDAFPGETFSGQVARVAPVIDPATRTAQIEIDVPNPEARLKPGMYARVRLTVTEHADALVVPRNAIVDTGGRRGVFVTDGKVARFKSITTGIQDQDRVEVLDGLDDGERVVTTGAAALRDGDAIQVAGQRPGLGDRGGPGGPSPAGSRQPAGRGPGPVSAARPPLR